MNRRRWRDATDSGCPGARPCLGDGWLHGIQQGGSAVGIGSGIGCSGDFRLLGRPVTGGSVDRRCRLGGNLSGRTIHVRRQLRGACYLSCLDTGKTASEFQAGSPLEGREPLAVRPLCAQPIVVQPLAV